MYIQPNTTIKLLTNVRVDKEYKNTILFYDAESQAEYFSSKLISPQHELNNYTYQKYVVDNGTIKVNLRADSCYNCNYLMFRNSSYSNKWFYAFVTSVQYVNEECCRISYKIDEMQTWLFDVDLLESYVEREHSKTDNIGENITTEPVPIGEYIANEVSYRWFDNLRVVIQYAKKEAEWETQGAYYKNIYSALETSISATNTVENVSGIIREIQQNGGKVVNVYMTPDEFIPSENQVGWRISFDSLITTKGLYGMLDNHKVRNKKLFTYPYNYCNVSATNGASVDYMFEYGFSQTFEMLTNMCNNVSVTLYNPSYKGIGWNFTDAITLDNFPICAWSDSAFAEYMGTQAIADTIKGVVAVGSGVTSSFIYNNPLATIGATIGAVNKITDVANMRNHPMRIGNTGNNVNNLMNDGKYGFTFARMSVKKEIAEIIDSYFDMYGYATHLVKVPNRDARKHWTYVKTNGCNVKSRAPIDSTQAICEIYDKGVTFWKNGDEIGNYSLAMREENAIVEAENG